MCADHVRGNEPAAERDGALAAEITKYETAIAQDPKSRAFALLAEAYRKAGRLQDAIRVAEEGLRNFPHYLSGRSALARAYFDSGDRQKAKAEFEQVVKAAPDNLMAHRHLAEIYQGEGRLPDAAKSLKMVALLDPRDEQSRIRLQAIAPDSPASPPPRAAPPSITPPAPSPPVGAKPAPVRPPPPPKVATVPRPPSDAPMEGVMERHRHMEKPSAAGDEQPALEVMTDQDMIHQPELSRRDEPSTPTPVFGDDGIFDAAFSEYEPPSPLEPLPDLLAPEEEPAEPSPPPRPAGVAVASAEPVEEVAEEDSYVFGRPRFDDLPEAAAGREIDEQRLPGFLEETGGEPSGPSDTGFPIEPESIPPGEGVRTETMAEIYFQQGLLTESLGIYRELAETRDDDPRIGERIREIERRMSSGAATEADARPGPVTVAPARSAREAEALRTLQEWLTRLKTRY